MINRKQQLMAITLCTLEGYNNYQHTHVYTSYFLYKLKHIVLSMSIFPPKHMDLKRRKRVKWGKLEIIELQSVWHMTTKQYHCIVHFQLTNIKVYV